MIKITDKNLQKYIKDSKNKINQKYVLYCIGSNLWFRVNTTNGNAVWLYRIAFPSSAPKSGYQFSYYTIGGYPEVTLLKAKTEALRIAEQIKAGINPNKTKDLVIKPKNITFKYILNKWLEASTYKPTTLYDIYLINDKYFNEIKDVDICSISDKAIWDTIIQLILNKGHIPRASVVLLRLKQIMKFAYHSYIIDELKFDRLVIAQIVK